MIFYHSFKDLKQKIKWLLLLLLFTDFIQINDDLEHIFDYSLNKPRKIRQENCNSLNGKILWLLYFNRGFICILNQKFTKSNGCSGKCLTPLIRKCERYISISV